MNQMRSDTDMQEQGEDAGYNGYTNPSPDIDFDDAQFLKGNGPTFADLDINDA